MRPVNPSMIAFGTSRASFTQAAVSSIDSSLRTSSGRSSATNMISMDRPSPSTHCVGGPSGCHLPTVSGIQSWNDLIVVVFSSGYVLRMIANRL